MTVLDGIANLDINVKLIRQAQEYGYELGKQEAEANKEESFASGFAEGSEKCRKEILELIKKEHHFINKEMFLKKLGGLK